MLWASWPNVSVHLIYNFFYGDSIKDLVESGAKTAVRDDSTLGFACWNDMQWNKHLPGSMLSVDVTTNLLISCYYDVQLKFDLNGGYMKTGSPAA